MRKLLSLLFLLSLASPAVASDDAMQEYVPGAEVTGTARLSWLLWEVYDATLYAPGGAFSRDKPFALRLKYLLEIEGSDIAKRSCKEMRNQGYDNEVKLAAWFTQMKNIFPDVTPGTELTGFYQPGGPTIFYKDGQEIGTIRDPEFGKHFFDIWLSEDTTEPAMRRKLMGES